jgi:sodium-dependent dicarboxylate transporter 2/3/5
MEGRDDVVKPKLIVLALILGVATWYGLRGFPNNQGMVGAIFAFTVTLWATEALPLTMSALLGSAALILVGGLDEKKVFASFGDPLLPLFIGSFILGKAMEETGLSERFAWQILRTKGATKSGSALLLALAVIGIAISLFVSNTATTAMLLPIGLSLLRTLGREQRGSAYAVAVMLMLTWGSSVAVGVPVGTPPNLIGIGLIQEATGQRISFGQWMVFAMPITIVMGLASWLVLSYPTRRDHPKMEATSKLAQEKFRDLGPLRPSERGVLIVFAVALVLWMLPDLMGMMASLGAGPKSWDDVGKRLTPAVTALIVAALLLILPAADTHSKRVMTWKQAASIDWSVIILFGGGIALGQAMFSSGLAKTLGEYAALATGANSLWSITALSIAGGIILSELASNTAAANVMVPIAIGLAQAQHVSVIPPALGAAIGASFGFMLPVSTAPNAIVYSSGLIRQSQMMRYGIAIDFIGFFATFGLLRWILPLMGLAG